MLDHGLAERDTEQGKAREGEPAGGEQSGSRDAGDDLFSVAAAHADARQQGHLDGAVGERVDRGARDAERTEAADTDENGSGVTNEHERENASRLAASTVT